MSEQRLVEIETKVTFQDHVIESLNQVVIEQQKKIDTLEMQLKFLMSRLRNPAGEAEIGPANEKPPHY